MFVCNMFLQYIAFENIITDISIYLYLQSKSLYIFTSFA